MHQRSLKGDEAMYTHRYAFTTSINVITTTAYAFVWNSSGAQHLHFILSSDRRHLQLNQWEGQEHGTETVLYGITCVNNT